VVPASILLNGPTLRVSLSPPWWSHIDIYIDIGFVMHYTELKLPFEDAAVTEKGEWTVKQMFYVIPR